MALVVEDGTGLATAESYVSVATADAYHLALSNASWAAAAVGSKESALRRATQYLDLRYQYVNDPITTTQALQWPRSGFTWPVKRLSDATCELALRALTAALFTDQDDRAVTAERVGPIGVEYSSPQFGGQLRYAIVDDLVAPLTSGGGRGSLRIERAS